MTGGRWAAWDGDKTDMRELGTAALAVVMGGRLSSEEDLSGWGR